MKRDIKCGDRYNRLSIVKEIQSRMSGGQKQRIFECLCDCGNTKVIPLISLTTGHTRSCGCFQRQRTVESKTVHGMTKTKEFTTWQTMIQRCTNPRQRGYSLYGGRGITVSNEWMDFVNFYRDIGKAPSEKYTLERIDNDGNYEKGNVRWATRAEQSRNKRNNLTFNGECAVDASKRLGGTSALVSTRISLGWSVERAFTTPVNMRISAARTATNEQ